MATLDRPDQTPDPAKEPWEIKPEAVAKLSMEKQFQFAQYSRLLSQCADAKDCQRLLNASRYFLLSYMQTQEAIQQVMAQQLGISTKETPVVD